MQRLTHLLLQIMIICLAAIIMLLPFHAFISTWGGSQIGPLLVWKSWKEILLVLLVPLVIAYLCIKPDAWRLLWRRWVNKLIILYFIMTGVFAVTSDASIEAAVAGTMMNLRFLAIFLLAQLVAASDHPWIVYVKKWIQPWLLTSSILVCILAVLQVSVLDKNFLTQFGYDKLHTIAPYALLDENAGALRAFSTLSGPNDLGAYLLLPLALAAALFWKNRRDILALAMLVIGTVTLFLTGSRSAWIGAFCALAMLALLQVPRKQMMTWLKVGALPLVAAGVLFLWLATIVPVLRLAIFHSSPGDAHLLEGSSQEHWNAVVAGLQNAFYHPFGQGVGIAGPASAYNTYAPPMIAENYFIQLAQEVGWYGLALFLAITVALVRQLWARRAEVLPCALLASFVGLSSIGLFLHVWADDPMAMVWWAVAGLVAFSAPAKRSKT